MLLKTEGGLQPGHRPQKPLSIFRSTTHVTRDRVAKTPYFSWNISCLALILGETGKSGQNPGLEAGAKGREIWRHFRMIHGRLGGGVPDSRSGLEMGGFPRGKGLTNLSPSLLGLLW